MQVLSVRDVRQGGYIHLIIDSDPIVYRCGFAAERTDYHLVVESPGGAVKELHFSPTPKEHAGAQMRKWLLGHPKWEILSKTRDVHPDSEEQAREAVRTQVYSIEKECRAHLHLSEFEKITVVLSGPGNYRDRIATIFPYKGNRDPEHKPYWYQSIRNHLTAEWGAIVVHGREADDECSILAAKSRRGADRSADDGYIIATIDKDLDQIPGRHYNYLKQVFYSQAVGDAETFFWQQCLSGDPTDGIPGCWKIGEAKAQKFLARIGGGSQGNIWEGIVREYALSQRVAGCPYVGRDAAAVALETARLVYLQQEEGELWNPPGQPMGTLPEYTDE